MKDKQKTFFLSNWCLSTYAGYSGVESLYSGRSSMYLLYIHFTLKCRFMYSALVLTVSCSVEENKQYDKLQITFKTSE